MALFSNILFAFKLTLIIALACALAFFIHVLLSLVTDHKAILYNPLLSGFLHQDLEHLGLNMLVLFVCLLHPINQQIGFKQLFFISTIISSIYYLLVVLQIMPFAIGLSGVCNYFLSRALLKSKPVFKWFLAAITVFELLHVLDTTKTAHLVHLIGLFGGWLSVKYFNKDVNLQNTKIVFPTSTKDLSG
jgi:membrane associated rhomboid family serine protease